MAGGRRTYELVAVALGLLIISCGGGNSPSPVKSKGASVRGEGGTGITNSVSSPQDMKVGDIMPISFGDQTKVSVSFSGVADSSQYILIVGSANTGGNGTSMQVAGDVSALFPDIAKVSLVDEAEAGDLHDHDGEGLHDEKGWRATEVMDAWLRAAEDELPGTAVEIAPALSLGKGVAAKAASVGDIETFRVLASLSSVSSSVEVKAKAACIGKEVAIYVDTRVTSELLSDAEIQDFCTKYDAVAQDEIKLFGEPSDVDGNGHVIALFTPQINKLGSMGGGIITGYFYAGDLYQRNGSNGVSNQRG